MKFWPFPILRNYPTNDSLSELFLTFASDPEFQVTDLDTFWITISCSLGRLKFWNENRWYAWAKEGSFIDSNGNTSEWSKEMPSRYAVLRMREAIGLLPRAGFKWSRHDQ